MTKTSVIKAFSTRFITIINSKFGLRNCFSSSALVSYLFYPQLAHLKSKIANSKLRSPLD